MGAGSASGGTSGESYLEWDSRGGNKSGTPAGRNRKSEHVERGSLKKLLEEEIENISKRRLLRFMGMNN